MSRVRRKPVIYLQATIWLFTERTTSLDKAKDDELD